MNTPTIQNIADQKEHLLRKRPTVGTGYDHAFEELVLTRSAEYRGEILTGATAKLAEKHGMTGVEA